MLECKSENPIIQLKTNWSLFVLFCFCFHMTQSGRKPVKTVPCYRNDSTKYHSFSYSQVAASHQSPEKGEVTKLMPAEFVHSLKQTNKQKTYIILPITIQFLITFHWLELCHRATLRGKKSQENRMFFYP